MFVETRKQGRKTKYYLIYTYRVGSKIKRVSHYLGSDLSKNDQQIKRILAEEIIREQIKESIFEFELSKEEIASLKKFDSEIEVQHLQKLDWNRFTEEFTYNTNAIEGSTVAFTEVKALIENREEPKDAEELEAVNVASAVDFIRKTDEKFSLDLIKKLHLLCFKGTKHFAGELRNVEVVIRDGAGNIVHRGAPYEKVKSLLVKLVKWHSKEARKYPPLLVAAIVHNEFENIHPFQDGNGRVGRLLLNYILLRHKYPPINITLKDRGAYYQSLQIYEKMGEIRPTLKFLISQYKKQYK